MNFQIISVDYCESKDSFTGQFIELNREVSFSVRIVFDADQNNPFSENETQRCDVSVEISTVDLDKLPVVNVFDLLGRVHDLALQEILLI